MNTITRTEIEAVEAVNPIRELLMIPLSQLRQSSRNVRKTCGVAIPELAASILRVGLLQNLGVIQSEDGTYYEVIAGKRRLKALKLLVKRRKRRIRQRRRLQRQSDHRADLGWYRSTCRPDQGRYAGSQRSLRLRR